MIMTGVLSQDPRETNRIYTDTEYRKKFYYEGLAHTFLKVGKPIIWLSQ